MIHHFFKLIWNQRRRHALLLVEMLAAFLVLFGLFSALVYQAKNYLAPLGYDHAQTWRIQTEWAGLADSLVRERVEGMQQRLRSFQEVSAVSATSGNTPFSLNTWQSNVEFGKRNINNVNIIDTDADYAQVMGLELLQGRWLTKADNRPNSAVAVINQQLAKQLFGLGKALGKMVRMGDSQFRVVGVIKGFKPAGEFQPPTPAMFRPYRAVDSPIYTLLVRVKSEVGAAFEARMIQTLAQMNREASIEVAYLTDQRQFQHRLVWIPLLIFALVGGFLLFNVALGLLGMLNLSIARRRAEIGLRRALGATQTQINWHFHGEMAVMATLAISGGNLLALQFPLLRIFGLAPDVYLAAIVLAMGITYGMVGLCTWYPSRQAAKLHPATALHED